MADINDPIIKEQSIKQDCSTGMHDWDKANAILEPVGNYTRVRMKCYWCKEELVRDEPLNINNIIAETTPTESGIVRPQVQEDVFGPKPAWATKVEDKYSKDQQADEFWGNIKKGMK